MIKKIPIVLLFFSFSVLSQNEQLKIEIIDVFKEYAPEISNSIKISEQPIFNDTLKNKIFTNSKILNPHISSIENIIITNPNKFRFKKNNIDFKQYFSLSVGNKAFFNTNFHICLFCSNISNFRNNDVFHCGNKK